MLFYTQIYTNYFSNAFLLIIFDLCFLYWQFEISSINESSAFLLKISQAER